MLSGDRFANYLVYPLAWSVVKETGVTGVQELQELQNTSTLIFFEESYESLTCNANILSQDPFKLSPELLNS